MVRYFCTAIALCGAFVGGCAKGRVPPSKDVFGEMAPHEDVDFAPYLAAARAVLTHKPIPPAPRPALPAERAFVVVWSPHRDAVFGTALKGSLFDSVVAATQTIAAPMGADFRIQLDVVKSAEPTTLQSQVSERLSDFGLHGFLVTDSKHIGYVLPSELTLFRYGNLARARGGMVSIGGDRLMATLAARASVAPPALADFHIYQIATTSRIESAPPGGVVPLFRGSPPHSTMLSPAQLLDAARAGADYLSRVLGDDGRYQYLLHPVLEEEDHRYGMLRHAGSTYALFEAYGEFKNPTYLNKGVQALGYMKKHLVQTPNGAYLIDGPGEEQQKSGGAGLALVALTKHAEITGSRENLEIMRSLGRFIVHAQYADGHFRANADVEREDVTMRGKGLKPEVMYYAGEATLGLVRLYAIDPNSQWLDAAKKSADFIIFHRDAQTDEEHQLHDHWGSYALLDLYRVTRNEAYKNHAFKIARSILKAKDKPAPAPDYAGAFFEQGETTPTSTRLEALTADMELSRFAGISTAWLDRAAMDLACFMRGAQLDADSAYFARRPDLVVGGVRESLLNPDVRIDYVQHAMSAWLHLARILRDQEAGARAPQ